MGLLSFLARPFIATLANLSKRAFKGIDENADVITGTRKKPHSWELESVAVECKQLPEGCFIAKRGENGKIEAIVETLPENAFIGIIAQSESTELACKQLAASKQSELDEIFGDIKQLDKPQEVLLLDGK